MSDETPAVDGTRIKEGSRLGEIRGNLVVQFSAASLLVLMALAVTLAYVLSSKVRSDAVDDLVDEAVGTSSDRLIRALTPADFELPMTGDRYGRFHDFVQRSIVSERTARVKLWSTDGTVIYSNDPAGVGENFPTKENLLKAVRGETAIEIKTAQDAKNDRERHLGTLIEIYSPVTFPGDTAAQGVLEIYQYYGPTADRIDDMRL